MTSEVDGVRTGQSASVPTAIVTGGGSGIGAATCRRLANAGWNVVVGDSNTEESERTAELIRSRKGTAFGYEVDVRDFTSLERLRDICLERFGRIDLLVASAGIVESGEFATGDPSRIRDVVETNLLGSMLAARSVVPSMVESASGHIVLLASIAGRESYVGYSVYGASKWGVVGFGRSLRKELASVGVRVTLIEPGLVDTPMARTSSTGLRLLHSVEALKPEDVAEAIFFVVSQDSRVAVNEMVVQPRNQDI